MPLKRKNYAALAQPVGPYVHAVESNGMLYLSGITAFGSPAQGKSIATQAEAVFEQIEVIAKAEGVSVASLVKVTIFITSFKEVESLRAALFKFYGTDLPASSLVQVASLFSPEVSIEIEAVLALS